MSVRSDLKEIARANLKYMDEDQAAEWVAEMMEFVLESNYRPRKGDKDK